MYERFSALRDLRRAIRLLRNSPGFSAVAIGTVALTIGANTAMFSVVNGLLLRSLPYPDSDRIVRVLEKNPNGGTNSIATLNYLDWADQNTVFEYLAAEAGWSATLSGGEEPELIQGARMSARYFDIFGTKAALGRTFLPGEDQLGSDDVVLLSHALWERRFGADPSIIGRDIFLDDEAHTVVGVLEQGGPFDRAAAQIFKPLAFAPSNQTRDFRWLGASAKLKPGVTLEQARVSMDVIARRLATAYPDSNEQWGVTVDRLEDVLIGPQLKTAVVMLFAATVFVLLIGCANLANLALARSISRGRDVAVRAALGASRWRLAAQSLIENVVISLCGGIAGVFIGYATMKWIESLIPPYTLPPAVDIRMDTAVLLFTLIVAVVTGLVFGAAPAAQAMKPNVTSVLKEGGHGATSGASGRRMRGTLVVAEVALAFVLLVASGLLMRSFFELVDIEPGFDASNVLTASLPIRPERHPDALQLNEYLASVRAAVDALPGVTETAITSALPLRGWGYGVPYTIADRESTDGASSSAAFFKIVSPSYFDALRIKLVSGRMLNEQDTEGAPPVALINETLARREFPDRDPIGHRILVPEVVPGRPELGREISWQIVGVVAGERITGLGDPISAGMYVANRQSPTYSISLIVRAEVPPRSLERAVRSAVASVSAEQAVSDVRTLDEIVEQSTLGNRVLGTLLGVFASIALLLAAVGIYGVVSYTSAQRTHEIGIRAALGASTRNLRMLVFGSGMRLTLIGLAIGLAGTLAATRVMSSVLYAVSAQDPLTIAVVAAVLASVAALACLWPAWRITRADPTAALRQR